ncbi:thermonuclease family protein [Insolitispirillum peregrinum]|uniref:Endonuclease YncB, thermonuclease family n=1 Tax=Insolitispirillum peregrinum TaxID=80876 RepID=A0A1N7NSP7_9PROT|nr:thermonuclease family protein [Insolitispirillum peregrinum]SIT01395.1 Endonuclease YncB, thermonuclease family [Insolitispirillum peregrinum]
MRVLLVLLSLCLLPLPAMAATVSGTARVIDGDTVVIRKKHIRLIGIDAPEKRQTCMRWLIIPSSCGKQATLILTEMVKRKTVTCDIVDTDRYGRLVGRCFVGDTDLNREMVRRGWALSYWTNDYKQEEGEARLAKAGIWATRFEKPSDFRKK